FSLPLDGARIDPSATYTIQATIVDGEVAFVTGHGVPVLTKGNPSKVDITLTYRPDLLKGAVSGQITGVGISPSPAAYAMTVLVDPSTGDSLGIQVQTVDEGLPVGFSVAYAITDIKPDQDYVVTAEVGDEGVTWRNAAGVPVITNGNPKSGVQVVVTPVVAVAASPTVAAGPTASAAPASPLEPTSQGSSLLAIIILIAIVVAIVAFFVARGRAETPPPTDGEGGAGAAAVAGAGEADTAAATEPTATTPSGPPTAPPA
ncbi:MAG: YbaY family lipoprotein, partial [Chloroflexota bacterium]